MRQGTRTPPDSRHLRGAALTILAGLVLASCSGGDPGADRDAEPTDGRTGTSTEAPLLQPGRPGEDASTIDPADAPSTAEWNHTDQAFAQMMVPHHGQALEMSRLAATRARSPEIKALARRIQGAQGPEIRVLAAWLTERNLTVPRAVDDADVFDHGNHGHTEMAGMLTDEEMQELRAARGRRFDRLFLRGMISHHQGAVEMAESVGKDGSDVIIAEMAADVTATQSAEIVRMRELLRRL